MPVHSPAPTAQFQIKRTREVDVHAGNLADWDQVYEQTSPGVFDGRVRELMFDDLQVFEEVASCATSQRCRPWPGGIWLGLSVPEGPGGLRFMGHETHGSQLMLASGDAPFDLQVPAGHGLYGLVVERASLVRHLREQHHAQWPLDWADRPSVQALGVPQRLRLAGLVREVLASLQAQPAVLQQPASRRALHEALIGLLADTLVPEAVHTLGHPRQQRRHELVRRVRELVMSQTHEAPTVDQLCSRLHVTRRTLQNSFQEALGMSPGVYLRTIRLNAVRRALREEGRGHTIADTAARWGFWHMGHFSQEYKALFGETPTQTRQSALAH
jgi:AraC family ethanolamine operon transcriptional activator